MNQPTKEQFNAAAQEAAEFAANAGSFEEELVAMTHLLRHQRTIELCLTAKRLERFGGPPPDHERLPLMDEDGYAFGEVVARIPEDLFFGLEFQKDFGKEAIHTKEGLRDVLKAYPVCKTKTVSGKTTVPVGGNFTPRRKSGVNFGRGTLKLAQ